MTASEQACAKILAIEKRREYSREYQRRWRAAHPEKQKEYQARYWAKKGQEELARLVAEMEAGAS